jgi:hypothetical protein
VAQTVTQTALLEEDTSILFFGLLGYGFGFVSWVGSVEEFVVSSPISIGDATTNTVFEERIEQITQLDQAKYIDVYVVYINMYIYIHTE